MRSFDEFVAIDWSGAKGRRYRGIAVARCTPGRSAPELVAAPGGSWTRTAAADWLDRRLENGARLLVGFDFAFGFPHLPKEGYLGGHAGDVTDIFALWALIDGTSRADGDFGCAGMIEAYAGLFWTEGPRPETWIERRRLAEQACALATGTHPESLYKLLHSKQVGKASMTGIRVLRALRGRNPARLAIWPFDEPRRSVAVEIYPTLFRKESLGSVAKITDRATLNRALRHYDTRGLREGRSILSDHDTDALLSAAALRAMAHDPVRWMPPRERVRREGWIFGVQAP